MTFNGKSACLTLEWTQGFTLSYEGIGEVAWRYKFSQLRGSSDDGKSRLKLHFQELDSIAIETKVRKISSRCCIECLSIFDFLFSLSKNICIHNTFACILTGIRVFPVAKLVVLYACVSYCEGSRGRSYIFNVDHSVKKSEKNVI